ncbi:MAG: (d)CMP kinase [Lachnospiraceae bacterium]|nr:(d)CMP kinase [Lachnospiraceae bacterium]
MSFAIAIDGPAGAGKSSAARQAAQKLQFVYVDTGAMYRTIALYMLENRVDTDDEEALKAALDRIRIELKYKDGVQCMYLNGEDVSGRIRTPEVSAQASVVAAIPAVRAKLLDLQRNMAASQNVLMDGRDIGTNILPDAELKIYLTASVEERARRRFLELTQKGEECSLEEIQKDSADRDWRDMHRETAPLKQAEDAVYLDTSDMTLDEVVERITQLAEERM